VVVSTADKVRFVGPLSHPPRKSTTHTTHTYIYAHVHIPHSLTHSLATSHAHTIMASELTHIMSTSSGVALPSTDGGCVCVRVYICVHVKNCKILRRCL
jgi:hypothetical protein